MRSRPGLRRWALAGVAGLLGGPAVALATGGPAGAEAVRSVVAKASAQGVRAVYTIPDYVVVSQIFDGGGPVTQAEADSTGRATSFAALPYPGENAIAAPGVLSVAFGRSVPLAYPFYVQADHPTAPAAELKDPSGSYSLDATAADGAATAAGALQRSSGKAGEAPEASGTRSTSAALLDDAGVVRTVAESVSTGISVGDGALRIASVTTRSETVLGPGDARPVTTTSLVVEGASVAGHAVTVDGGGVHAEGQAVPAPLGQGAGSDNQFLGQLGLSARIVPAGVPGGADALVITSSQTFPAPGNPKGTLVITFGGAASEITVGSPDGPSLDTPAADAGATPAPGGTTPSGASPGATEVAGASPLTSSAVLARSGVGSGPVGAGLPIDGPAPHAPTAVAAPGAGEIAAPASGPVAVRGASRLVVQPDLATTGALYSLLGLGGIAMVGATRLLRWKGARP
ncbi:MAG TPA: hypothetical protein VEN99_10265 [Acidimicrobiia bacterium]|nr:hypothetical protein [Acidimicrobiia bacterium]